MKPAKPPERPMPIRRTLTEQAAECIRQGLRDGRWVESIPAEGELCRELGISRGTLRRALAMLFKENLLRPGGRGGRHGVVRRRKTRKSADLLKGQVVRILSPQPRFVIAGHTQIVFQTISEVLGRAGLSLELEHHTGLWSLRKPNSRLRKMTSQANTAGWVLYRSTGMVQEWFSQSGIPAVALGGIYPDVELSHGEFDLTAASRHAAGIFAARGHRRMVFLSVEQATAGDHASGSAFIAAAAASGAHAEVATFDDTVPGLCHVLDGLLLSKPVPTAFLVACANHVLATVGHLSRRGFTVPKHAAVISRMDAVLLAECIPTIARYKMNAERLGRGIGRLLLQNITSDGKAPVSQFVVMPEFVDGETAGGRAIM